MASDSENSADENEEPNVHVKSKKISENRRFSNIVFKTRKDYRSSDSDDNDETVVEVGVKRKRSQHNDDNNDDNNDEYYTEENEEISEVVDDRFTQDQSFLQRLLDRPNFRDDAEEEMSWVLDNETEGHSMDKTTSLNYQQAFPLETRSARLNRLASENDVDEAVLMDDVRNAQAEEEEEEEEEEVASTVAPFLVVNAGAITNTPVNPLVQSFIDIANYKYSAADFPDDFLFPLDSTICRGSGEHYSTKQEFCEGLKHICAFYSIEVSAMNAFVKLLNRLLPKLNLPIKVMAKTGNAVYKVEQYLKRDLRRIVVDVCIKECIIYAGAFETDIFCPVCYTYRFRPCKINKCKDGQDCSPFINITHKKRTANQNGFYRPIIPKILEIYKRAVNENSNIFEYNTNRVRRVGFLTDVMDGTVPTSEMELMHQKFLVKKIAWEAENPGKTLIELSLCLSLSYDGDLLFKRSQASLWPMLCSIMNLDPSYRTKLGLGLFSILIHSLKVGSGAEKAFKDVFLAEEVQQMKNGIVFEFAKDNGEHVAVYLQARVVFFHCDTKGHEKNLCVQGCASMAGCAFCNSTKGLSRSIIGTCIYTGHTLYLPQDHVFRTMGECEAQPGYFGDLDVDQNQAINQKIGADLTHDARQIKIRGGLAGRRKKNVVPAAGVGGRRRRADVVEEIVVEDLNDLDEFEREARLDAEANLTLVMLPTTHPRSTELPPGCSYVSTLFPFCLFASAIWFPQDDPRPYIDLPRKTNETFIANSASADTLKDEYMEWVNRLGRPPAKDKTYTCNGVHDGIPKLFAMESPRFEWLTHDFMHGASLSISHFMEIMMGDRGLNASSRQLSLAQHCRPFLETYSIPAPWFVSKEEQRLADWVYKCINFPSPYKTDCKYDHPFHYLGNMNSHKKIVFMVSCIVYFLSFTSISSPYKCFFERYSWDLSEVMNPFICAASLPYLKLHVIETKALQEGLFPCSEQNFIYHEMVEIINHMEKFGIAKALMCYFSERAMKALSDSVPDGGQKFVLTVTDRFVGKEDAYEMNFAAYSKSLEENCNNDGRYCSDVLKLTRNFKHVVLNIEIKNIMYNNVFEFLGSQLIRFKAVKSRFYRIYMTYEEIYRKYDGPEEQCPSLSDWLTQVYMRSRTQAHIACNFQDLGIVNIVDEMDITSYFQNLVDPSEDLLLQLNTQVEDLFISKCVLFLSDLNGIIADMAMFASETQLIAAFTHATIKGVLFTARGESFAENQFNRDVLNTKNVLCNNWHQLHQYSSWCRVRDWFLCDDGESVTDTTYFAQLNYFFRLYIPSDELINGLAFANAVLRKPTDSEPDPNRGHFCVSPVDTLSFYPHKQFIALNYVVATALGVSALDHRDLPMMNPTMAAQCLDEMIKKYPPYISRCDSSSVAKLYFIEIHKERLKIVYDTIESDNDRTKVFESSVRLHHKMS